MTEFQNKSFKVYPGKDGGKEYRDNWDATFGKKSGQIPGADAVPAETCQGCLGNEYQHNKLCPCREPPSSPGFTPEALKDLEARGFVRINNPRSTPSSCKEPETCAGPAARRGLQRIRA